MALNDLLRQLGYGHRQVPEIVRPPADSGDLAGRLADLERELNITADDADPPADDQAGPPAGGDNGAE